MMPPDSRNPEILIPEQLSHPMALRTETLLESSNEDRTNRVALKSGVSFHIYVSRAQMSRALRIWERSVGRPRRTRLHIFLA
jgi:hypothetical protein